MYASQNQQINTLKVSFARPRTFIKYQFDPTSDDAFDMKIWVYGQNSNFEVVKAVELYLGVKGTIKTANFALIERLGQPVHNSLYTGTH